MTPEGVASVVLIGSLGSFGSFSIIFPLPSRPYQRWPVSDNPSSLCKSRKKKKMLFIHLDDYKPLMCASDWLLQTTSQMHDTVYFSDLRGHEQFFKKYGLFVFIHLCRSCLPVQGAALDGLVYLVFCVFFLYFLFYSSRRIPLNTNSIHSD